MRFRRSLPGRVSSERVRQNPRLLFSLLIGAGCLGTLSLLPGLTRAEEPLPVAILATGATTVPEIGAIAFDPDRHKLYVGVRRHAVDRLSLWVFDVAADGQPTGRPRKYPDSLEPLTPGHWTWPIVLHLDTQRRRLCLGVAESHNQTEKTLGIYDLDDRGEPIGVLRSVATGNPLRDVQAIVPHPRLNRLYLVGWGHAGLCHVDLDAEGHPQTPAVSQAVGGYGKYSLAFDATGRRAYLGTYPSVLEVADLDEQGMIRGTPRSIAMTAGPQAYLTFASGPRGLYFAGPDQRLAWWPIDGQGEPAASPRLAAGPMVEAIAHTRWAGGVLAAIPRLEADVFTGARQSTGTQPVRIPLADDGTPGEPVPLGPGRENAKTVLLGAGRGVALGVTPQPAEFRINRTRGIELRATLHAIEGVGMLPPQVEFLSAGREQKYLQFVLSDRHPRLHTVIDGELATFEVVKPTPLSQARKTTRPLQSPTGRLALDHRQQRLLSLMTTGEIESLPLDERGLPQAPTTWIPTGLKPVAQMVAHPTVDRIYVLGVAQPGVKADERIVAIPSSESWQKLELDPVRGRLYGVTHYHGQKNLAVWKLDDQGRPLTAEPTWYTDPFSRDFVVLSGEGTQARQAIDRRGTLSTLRLDATRRRLYVGASPEQPQKDEGFVIVYSLDERGDPRDEPAANESDFDARPRVYQSPGIGNSVLALVTDPDRKHLWEGGWGDTRLFRWRLDERGEPQGPPTAFPAREYGKSDLAFTPGGDQLLMGTWPAVLERIAFDSDGRPVSGAFASLDVGGKTVPLPFLSPGVQTDWIPLDEMLKNGIGRMVVRLVLQGGTVQKARVQLEVRHTVGGKEPREESSWQKSFDMELVGTTAAVLLPRLGEAAGEAYQNQVESSTEYYQRCLEYARRHAVPVPFRPQQLMIANGVIGIDSNARALEAGLEAVELLGHNTVQIWGFPGVDGDGVGARARQHRLLRARGAIYNPPSYFDFDRPMVAPSFLDTWAREQTGSLVAQGASTADLALFHLADEPGWYYPQQYAAVTQSSERLEVFREYLRGKGLSPADVGQTTWEGVAPQGQSTARQSVPQKRLHYWTTRFYAESLSQSFAAATAALQRQLNQKVLTTTNLNNWPGRFYIPSPGQPIANNADRGPEAAMGMPDWFDLGRKQGVTCLWTEDWFPDQDAGMWSLYADLLRSATRGPGLEFGGYVVGHSTGWSGLNDGGALKMLALVGHGAKVIDPYTFGPNAAFADGWSDSEARYQSLGRGIELLGRAEALLHPGRPRPARVAVVFPQASQVWNSDARLPEYQHELYGLHAALMHTQHTVDFLDDVALEENRLAEGGYRVLYVTSPDLSLRAQQRLVEWVRQGGTLAVLPGACAFDELHEPAGLFAQALRTGPLTTVPRIAALPLAELANAPQQKLLLAAGDPRLAPPRAGEGELATAYTVTPIPETGAEVLVRTATGEALLAIRAVGAGRVVQYGFWPGCSYWGSPDRSDVSQLPLGWSPRLRELATLPCRLAEVPVDVQVSTPMLEPALLESDRGIAVTLLNWSGAPQDGVEVTVTQVPFVPRQVRTARGRPVTFVHEKETLRAKLPVETVDVLMIER